MTIDLFSAFVIGLLGSGHCLGMCGGISTILTSALPQQQTSIQKHPQNLLHNNRVNNNRVKNNLLENRQRTTLVLLYHIGRIFSYGLIGAIVGYTGSIAAKNIGLPLVALRLVAAFFLILLGLYLGQWLMLLTKVEALGKKLWQLISPLSKKLIPVDSPTKALGLGVLWGWLPCGLVYSTLAWSLASGSLLSGMLIMIFFGLGTLPALLSMSLGFFSFKNLFSNAAFRKFLAISLIIYGVYSLFVATKLLFRYY